MGARGPDAPGGERDRSSAARTALRLGLGLGALAGLVHGLLGFLESSKQPDEITGHVFDALVVPFRCASGAGPGWMAGAVVAAFLHGGRRRGLPVLGIALGAALASLAASRAGFLDGGITLSVALILFHLAVGAVLGHLATRPLRGRNLPGRTRQVSSGPGGPSP